MRTGFFLFLALVIAGGCDDVSRGTEKALGRVGVSEREQNEIKREYLQPVGDEISDALDSAGLSPSRMGKSLAGVGKTARRLGKKGSRTVRSLTAAPSSDSEAKSRTEMSEEMLQERDERIDHF